ncbi:unnamed protein product, partial [Prorocentrum cordatum]
MYTPGFRVHQDPLSCARSSVRPDRRRCIEFGSLSGTSPPSLSPFIPLLPFIPPLVHTPRRRSRQAPPAAQPRPSTLTTDQSATTDDWDVNGSPPPPEEPPPRRRRHRQPRRKRGTLGGVQSTVDTSSGPWAESEELWAEYRGALGGVPRAVAKHCSSGDRTAPAALETGRTSGRSGLCSGTRPTRRQGEHAGASVVNTNGGVARAGHAFAELFWARTRWGSLLTE